MNTGKLFAVFIVSESAVFNCPAFVYNVSHCVAVFEVDVYIFEVSTRFLRIIRIHEGLKSVNFLVFRFLSEGIERICSEVCLVAKFTCIYYVETVLVPISTILRCKLDTCYQAKRICISGINRLSLVNPVELKCQCVCCFIESARCQ